MTGTIRVEGENLVFQLHGIDKILSIKQSLAVPLKHVVSVSTEKVDWKPFQHLRVGGSSLPGIVKDGRFVTPEGWVFFEMRDGNKCVTVTLDNEFYKKIVFQVEDKWSVAKMINDAIEKRG
jgi:hypothetical protein